MGRICDETKTWQLTENDIAYCVEIGFVCKCTEILVASGNVPFFQNNPMPDEAFHVHFRRLVRLNA